MNLRKEPVLFVAVVLLAAYMWNDRAAPQKYRARSGQTLDYTEPKPVPVVLAQAGGPGAVATDDLFREPAEAVPLPPRPLPYPELQPLPVLAPPLMIGPEAGAFYVLREPATTTEQHTLRAPSAAGGGDGLASALGGDESAGGGASSGGSQDPDTGRLPEEVLIQRFDRIWRPDSNKPFFGIIQNSDKLELHGKTEGIPPIVMDLVSQRDGSVVQRKGQFDEVVRVMLADNLSNRIALRKRAIPGGPAGERERVAFLGDLLRDARENPWVFQEAEAQAQLLLESTGGSLLGYRWLVRVLRAQGALSREFELYDNLPEELADSAARWREQGRFEAGLTLWADAEEHLRKAVDIAPGDSRSQGALAGFLLSRGRAAEALQPAQAAMANLGKVFPEQDRAPIVEAAVSTFLAVGSFDEAQNAAYRMGSSGGSADEAYLLGCVEYARAGLGADVATRGASLTRAAELFETAAGEERRFDALLGLGCTRARQGQWDAAHQLLLRVRDEAPALRARALAALGFLYERTANAEQASAALQAAELVDPSDPYVLYMAARQQRLGGDPSAALQTMRRALAARDDLTEAFGEVTAALLEIARSDEGGGSEYLANAARFVDRLVKLDETRGRYVPYMELQGRVMALIGDVVAARNAFGTAASRGSHYADLALCLLDYRGKRITRARQGLVDLADDRGRPAGTREFAREVLLLIDDHQSKEQVRDDFDRDRLGGFWNRQGRARVAVPLDGRLKIIGDDPRGSSIDRKAIRAGDILSFEATMQVEAGESTLREAGLKVRIVQAGSGRRSFEVFAGFTARGTRLSAEVDVRDGQSDEEQDPVDVGAVLAGLDPAEPQRIELEFVPNSGESGSAPARRFDLVVRWNGVEVHRVAGLKSLRPNTSSNLVTSFVAQGTGLQVVFDDYRMERRKAQ